ncbi:unnamed protein product [Arabidopsis thaliana]|uniref:Uncharacterized protein n=1 Tax=Arabidopsis thaliana TaxID=3702 RepID=A0A654EWJ7_ARATH|nr:unnamed protein product [Arabidopsis thaliana]
MTSILSAVSKLRGCVNQIENKNPSGASIEDILNQAKMLLTQYEKYKRGFKFDHVWPILKGIEKFANDNMKTPLHSKEKVVMLRHLHHFQSIPSHHLPLV